jgi:manganese oxidase
MGMLRGGAATATENGPSMGRGMGVGSALEQPTTNGAMSPQASSQASPSQQAAAQGMGGMQMGQADVSKDANSVPGFPQDAFMESPAMAMDAMVEKPETHGLRPGWSGYMQGMMTLIRVLPPERYDEIESLREKRRKDGGAVMPGMSGTGEQR